MSAQELYQQYKAQRETFINETKANLNKDFKFQEKEEKANGIWEKMLLADRYQRDHRYYQVYTLQHRNTYEQQDIFKVLSKMPKGSSLHIHIDCCIDNEWFIAEMAYNGYCYLNKETGNFCYFKNEECATEGYVNLIKLREQMGAEACNEDLRKRLCVTKEEAYNFDEDVWQIFEKKILSFSQFFYNKSMWPIYLKKVFENFISEGISRIEARCFVGWLKDDDEQPVSFEEEFAIYENVIKEVQAKHPEFTFGMVIQGLKVWDQQELIKYYKQAFELRKKYPHIVIAFDMVQEEDAFKDTLTLAETFVLRKQLEAEYDVTFPFLFHGGESLDCQLNTNLYDVILLDTKRIGHGLNLIKHSNLIEEVKKRDICIEQCPVSNQVLRYTSDIRLHPIRSFLNLGVRVCIAPDDPGYFGINAVNHDFYLATIAARLTFLDLKQIIYNSIHSSLVEEKSKLEMWKRVESQWLEFVDQFLKQYDNEETVKSLDKIITNQPVKKFF